MSAIPVHETAGTNHICLCGLTVTLGMH